MVARVRFDDLTLGNESSFEFAEPVELVVARNPKEVPDALQRVDDLSRAGWWIAGYLSYDAAPGLDPRLRVPASPHDAGPPPAWFAAFRTRRRVEAFEPGSADSGRFSLSVWEPDVTRSAYLAAVAEIKNRIAAGDTYQVNHTFRLRARFSGDPLAFYRQLALAQRGRCGAFIDTGRHQIVSASPEMFFDIDGTSIRVRPMKGTIRRGRWPAEDEALAARLHASEKDRAENIMIVDLLRNDLGRLARFGSVKPDRLLEIERYDTVWQLTSAVSAELEADVTIRDVLGALFPSGSVTGAPKKRTMEIISNLETSARGVYCGAIGWIGPRNERGLVASFSVAIRTAVVDSASGTVAYGVGGGITWDSIPIAEYEEAWLKAHVLEGPRRPRALLETLRWDPGSGYLLLERHLDRIAASADYFGFPFDRTQVEAVLRTAAREADESRLVRLTSDRSGRIDVMIGEALPAWGEASDEKPVLRVAVSPETVASDDVLLFHKTTRREPYERRRRDRADVDDVLLVNERGEVTESTKANVAVRIDGLWYTPPLEAGCLPGTLRAELVALGELSERRIRVPELSAAEDVALINSVRGWRNAELVE